MDFTKTDAATTTITRNTYEMCRNVDNIYEMVMIISRRSNQISSMVKTRLDKKLQEFESYSDNLEEIFENKEQIEISKFYERLPKSTLIAIKEYEDDKIYHRLATLENTQSVENQEE